MGEDVGLRDIVLSAVKGIMKAHMEDMKKNGLVFTGSIMDVSIDDNFTSLDFKFSEEFKEFIVEHIKKGKLETGLEPKTFIILTDDFGDPRNVK